MTPTDAEIAAMSYAAARRAGAQARWNELSSTEELRRRLFDRRYVWHGVQRGTGRIMTPRDAGAAEDRLRREEAMGDGSSTTVRGLRRSLVDSVSEDTPCKDAPSCTTAACRPCA